MLCQFLQKDGLGVNSLFENSTDTGSANKKVKVFPILSS